MIFPQPPWNLFGVYRESEHAALLAQVASSGLTKYQIKHFPDEKKPYCLWIHDDELQLASDTLFTKLK